MRGCAFPSSYNTCNLDFFVRFENNIFDYPIPIIKNLQKVNILKILIESNQTKSHIILVILFISKLCGQNLA